MKNTYAKRLLLKFEDINLSKRSRGRVTKVLLEVAKRAGWGKRIGLYDIPDTPYELTTFENITLLISWEEYSGTILGSINVSSSKKMTSKDVQLSDDGSILKIKNQKVDPISSTNLKSLAEELGQKVVDNPPPVKLVKMKKIKAKPGSYKSVDLFLTEVSKIPHVTVNKKSGIPTITVGSAEFSITKVIDSTTISVSNSKGTKSDITYTTFMNALKQSSSKIVDNAKITTIEKSGPSALVDGPDDKKIRVYVGDAVGFKDGHEQYGTIVTIRPSTFNRNAYQLSIKVTDDEGDYVTEQMDSDCWVD